MKTRLNQIRRHAAHHLAHETVRISAKGGILSLSFDDFPQSAWREAGAILNEHDIKATYYVAGGLCGGTNIGKDQFTETDLCEVFAAGHEVGCHTFSHTSLLDLSQQALVHEIQRNAQWVAERLDGHTMQLFSQPYGHATLASKRILGQHFKYSRSVRDGINLKAADRNNLKAIGLESRRLPHYDLEGLIAKTAQNHGWLIAYGHDVEGQPTPYGCRPQDLENIILLAKQAGLMILPVGAAAQMLNP